MDVKDKHRELSEGVVIGDGLTVGSGIALVGSVMTAVSLIYSSPGEVLTAGAHDRALEPVRLAHGPCGRKPAVAPSLQPHANVPR